MHFIIMICTSMKAEIDTTESCTCSIIECILKVISMQLLFKKCFIKTEGKKTNHWSKEDDSTTVVPPFPAVIRSGTFAPMRVDREGLALFHPPQLLRTGLQSHIHNEQSL